MFAEAKAGNAMLTWILRLLGFVMMFAGLFIIFRPLAVVADVLPLAGDLLRVGLGLFSGLITAALSLFTISVAWLFYRPLLGIPLMLLAIGAGVGLVMMARRKKEEQAERQPAALRKAA